MDHQPLTSIPHHAGSSHSAPDTGALILFTSPTLIGSRIDLIPLGAEDSLMRAVVRERHLPQGVSCAAVFPRLSLGTYCIRDSEQQVTISSGLVTTLDYLEECCRIYYHPSTEAVLTLCFHDEDEFVRADEDDVRTFSPPHTPELPAREPATT